MKSSLFRSDSRNRFRLIGLLEGISYILLLGIAMPLKYVWHWPWAVKYVGWAHGALFVAYLIALFWAATECKWHWGKILLACVASLLPFGPFLLDKHVQRW